MRYEMAHLVEFTRIFPPEIRPDKMGGPGAPVASVAELNGDNNDDGKLLMMLMFICQCGYSCN